MQSLLETELSEENAKISQSPLGNLRKKHHILTPRQSERNLGIEAMSSGKIRKSTRFQIGGIGIYIKLYICNTYKFLIFVTNIIKINEKNNFEESNSRSKRFKKERLSGFDLEYRRTKIITNVKEKKRICS